MREREIEVHTTHFLSFLVEFTKHILAINEDCASSYTPSPVCVHFQAPFTSPWRWR